MPDGDVPSGMQTVGPITLDQWRGSLLVPPSHLTMLQLRVDVDFHTAQISVVSTTGAPTTRVRSLGGLELFENNRSALDRRVLVDLEPPLGTLPHGQWWEENRGDAASQHAALSVPGQPAVYGTTPGPYRLLPEPLIGRIRDRERFAFEVVDKTYLLERPTGNATPPTFTVFFDADAEQIWEGVVDNPAAALSRQTQSLTDGGQTFRQMFGLPPGAGNGVPAEMVEFGRHDVFASENWETFFHAPLQLADLLTRNNRFADAQRWLHSIYNPLSSSAVPSQPWEAWQFLPFYDRGAAPPRSMARRADDAGVRP